MQKHWIRLQNRAEQDPQLIPHFVN